MAAARMQVTRSYCFSGQASRLAASSRAPGRAVYTVRNHIFTGEPAHGSALVTPVAYSEQGPEVESAWRKAYRLKRPEEADPAWATLRARFEAQSRVPLPAASRHRSAALQAAARGRTQAHVRDMARAARRRLRAKLAPAAREGQAPV